MKFYDGLRNWKECGILEQSQQYFNQFMQQKMILEEDKLDANLFNKCFVDKILEIKYQKIKTKEVSDLQEHLTPQQRDQLNDILMKHSSIFDSKLGCYLHKKFQLDLIENYNLVFKRAYLVPFQREHLLKQELNILVKDGVLEKCGPWSWASPTFIVPKKEAKFDGFQIFVNSMHN